MAESYLANEPIVYTTQIGAPGGVASLDAGSKLDAAQLEGVVTSAALAAGAVVLSSAAVTNTLPAIRGGTGASAFAVGDVLYADTASTLAKLADVAAGSALLSGGVGAAPAYGKVGLTPHVSGVLPAASGGTGASAYAVGDVLYADTASTLAKLAGVAAGNALLSGGVGAAPAYGKVGLATHVDGTLAVANGGTGATALAANGVLYGAGASAVAATAAGTAEWPLRATAGAPAFSQLTAAGLAADAVTTAKILDANVTAAKLASRAAIVHIAPAFPSAVVTGTAPTLVFTAPNNYYRRTTNGTSVITFQYSLPYNFLSWGATPISTQIQTSTIGGGTLALTLYQQDSGTAVATTPAAGVTVTTTTTGVETKTWAIGGGTFAANQVITLSFSLVRTAGNVDLFRVRLAYNVQ